MPQASRQQLTGCTVLNTVSTSTSSSNPKNELILRSIQLCITSMLTFFKSTCAAHGKTEQRSQ